MHLNIFMNYSVVHPAPESLILEIQSFRQSIYALDGVIFSDEENSKDAASWHILCRRDEVLVGCLRYIPGDEPTVGGWAVASTATMIGPKLIMIGFAVGQHLGDGMVTAVATTRHNSAAMLQRLGAKILEEYEDEIFGPVCRLEFDVWNVLPKYQHIVDFGRILIND
jgi:hypothetical protein